MITDLHYSYDSDTGVLELTVKEKGKIVVHQTLYGNEAEEVYSALARMVRIGPAIISKD